MISAVLLSLLQPVVQSQPTEAAIVTGVVENGRLAIAGLGLGDGGLGTPLVDPKRLGAGETQTPGGVLVRVKEGGVKLDFPSGAELLVTVDARVHLRDGSASLPAFHGVTLELADGKRVVVVPSPGRNLPLEYVAVGDDERSLVLWRSRTRTVDAAWSARQRGLVLFCLGDGAELWKPTWQGPIVRLERILASRKTPPESQAQKTVVLGDVLRESLHLLPERVPRKTLDFPEAAEMVRELDNGRAVLFPRGTIPRPPGASGELVFQLAAGFRLQVRRLDQAPTLLTLVRGADGIPYVEWSIGPKTLAHIVRPDGTHWQREVDVTSLLPR